MTGCFPATRRCWVHRGSLLPDVVCWGLGFAAGPRVATGFVPVVLACPGHILPLKVCCFCLCLVWQCQAALWRVTVLGLHVLERWAASCQGAGYCCALGVVGWPLRRNQSLFGLTVTFCC